MGVVGDVAANPGQPVVLGKFSGFQLFQQAGSESMEQLRQSRQNFGIGFRQRPVDGFEGLRQVGTARLRTLEYPGEYGDLVHLLVLDRHDQLAQPGPALLQERFPPLGGMEFRFPETIVHAAVVPARIVPPSPPAALQRVQVPPEQRRARFRQADFAVQVVNGDADAEFRFDGQQGGFVPGTGSRPF